MIFSEISNCIINSISTILFLPMWIILMILLNLAIPLINSKKFTLNLTVGGSIINILFAIIALLFCIKNPNTIIENNILWFDSTIQIHLGTLVDNLSSLFLLITSIFSFFIQIFSYHKLKENPNFHKFYIYLNLINFSIFGLVLSSNVIQSFIFIVFTSICSYLLTTIFSKESTEAGQKFFIINKIGDICFLIGLLNLIYFGLVFNSSENLILLSYPNLTFNIDNLYSILPPINYSIIVLFIFACILVKLGQIPFICAILKTNNFSSIIVPIICILTSGISGIYLLSRLYPMIILSDFIVTLMIIIGSLSLLFGAYFSMSQNNLKKLLTCICIAQYGIILISFGIKSFSTSLFYFICFSLAYILIFQVISVLGEDINIKSIGNIRKESTSLATLFAIGVLSISGLLFSGFYANLFAFSAIYNFGNDILTILYLIAIFLITFSLARCYFLVFEGDNDFSEKLINPINYKPQLIIEMFFALITVTFGVLFKSNFYKFIYFISPDKYQPIPTFGLVVLLFVIISAIYISFSLYVIQNSTFMKIKENLMNKNNLIYKLSFNCFYVDDLCEWMQKNIIYNFCKIFALIEKKAIEVLTNLLNIINIIIEFVMLKTKQDNIKSCIGYSIILIFLILTIIFIHYLMQILLEV